MKFILLKSLRLSCLSLLLVVAVTITIYGQDAKLQISHLDKLETSASQVVDVNIDQKMLQLAAKFLSGKKPDEAVIKDLVSGLKGVYVRSYNFEKDGAYSMADIEMIRSQLRTPSWSKMVDVRSKREGQNVEVYTMLIGSQINGMAVIAAEPKQLTIVNIVGPIDIDKLSQLSGNFGIPQIDLKRNGKAPKE